MNELEELKARAAERLRRLEIVARNSGRRLHATADCDQAEADLDRAIALVESRQVVEDVNEILAANARNVDEHDKAIAAALALREALRCAPHYPNPHSLRDVLEWDDQWRSRVLADTAWLEDHEPDREADRRETLGDGQR